MPLFGPNIKKMKEKRDIRGLINALRNAPPQIRVEAIEALIDIDDPKVLELLLKEFSDVFRFGEEADKVEAITIIRACPTRQSLGAMTHSDSLGLILTSDSFTKIWKYEKVKFTKKLNLGLVRPILLEVAMNSGENLVIRWYTVTALAELGDRSDELVQLLINILDAMPKQNLFIVEESLRILSYFTGNPTARNVLMNSLRTGTVSRMYSIYALGALGDPLTRENLEYLVVHGDKNDRKRAEIALNLFGTASYDEIKAKCEKETKI
jgi:HEAT repeat protein